MLQTLIDIDQGLFLWLNSFHSPWADVCMLGISHSKTWIPMYLCIIGIMMWKLPLKKALTYLMLIIIAVGLSDYITSGLMKPYFARLRPCHDAFIATKMTLVGSCGGRYGFVSSHAANSFALFVALKLLFPAIRYFHGGMLAWAAVVAYSRVYLGVHYPADIVVGAGIGMATAGLTVSLFKALSKRLSLN